MLSDNASPEHDITTWSRVIGIGISPASLYLVRSPELGCSYL